MVKQLDELVKSDFFGGHFFLFLRFNNERKINDVSHKNRSQHDSQRNAIHKIKAKGKYDKNRGENFNFFTAFYWSARTITFNVIFVHFCCYKPFMELFRTF